MHHAVRVGAVVAALLAVAIGVADTLSLLRDDARAPRWAALLAPLRTAPLERGSVAQLSLPRSPSTEHVRLLLFEAAWQRPDVRWALAGERWEARARSVVTVADATAPPGWVVAWREGEVAVWLRPER